MIVMSVPSTIRASSTRSCGPKIAAVGLCGELIMIMRVRGVTADRTSSQGTA